MLCLCLSVSARDPRDGDVVHVFCSVCLTVEGVSYPTGTLLVQHINVVFLSPMGPSWASSAVCVSVGEDVCVRQPPLSVSGSD